MVQHYLDKKVLRRVSKAPEFSYPTYLVYSRERDSPPPCSRQSHCSARSWARTPTGPSAGTQ